MSQRGMKALNSPASLPPEIAAEMKGTPLLSGTLYRESGVVSGITNRRWAALYPHCVVTFRKEATKEPSKVWPLSSRCQLSKIKCKEFMLREKHTSTIWALAAGHYDRKQMFYFTVHGPSSHLFGKDGLKVCFEKEEDAATWREAFWDAISNLSTDMVGRHLSADLVNRSASTFQESPLGREKTNSITNMTPTSSPGSEAFMDHGNLAKNLLDSRAQMAAKSASGTMTPTSPEASQHTADLLRMTRESMNGSFTAKLFNAADEAPANASAQRMLIQRGEKRRWANLRHVNGVAVYQEHAEQSGAGGAFMVSAVVRATPKACFKALMEGSDWKDTPLLGRLEVLENLDAQSRVLKGTVSPNGAAHTMCAPREVVLQQMWREEEDGTFIVLLHSTKHRKASMPAPSWSWWQPIRAQMASAGFTIAPLSSKYQAAGVSQECLVTMVLKLDLGGWLSEQSGMGWLLRPFMHGIHSSYLEPMLMSVIALRDKVEQDRFTVKPFSMGQQSDPEKYERTATMCVRNRSVDRSYTSSSFQPSKLAAVRTNLVADASSSAEPLVQHMNAAGETVATVGEEGDGAGSDVPNAPANVGTCDPKYWSCPGAAGYKVRGQTYLKDKKKIEADEPVFGLASVDLVEVEAPTWHIAEHLPAIRDSKAPFTFVVQLMVPGPPFLSLTMAWAADYDPSKRSTDTPHSPEGHPSFAGNDGDSDSELVKSPFDLCLARFLAGDDKESEQRRSSMFKLIPSVVTGSWVIKQAVGNTPVLLGKKLTTRYFRGPGHFEVDVDVGSSRAAASVVGLVSPVTTGQVIDMAIVLEGREEQELPEQLLGTVRFTKVDMKSAAYLDINTGKIHPKGT